MATTSQTWRFFGASVRGPGHIRDGLPNQDAWRGSALKGADVIVVCDGLGSKPHSDHGAKQACRAVVSSVVQWCASPGAPLKALLRLIHATWSLRVHPHEESDCATTCLLAVAGSDGRIHVAQLGDGLSLVSQPESLHRVGHDRAGFGNETTGLGIARRLSDWATYEGQQDQVHSVLLATDGIADDLDSSKLKGFSDYVHATYSGLPPRQRWLRLSRDLRDWPTPLHSDDKTLAFLWRPNTENER